MHGSVPPMRARGEQRASQGGAQQPDRREAHLHPALLAWLDAWRALWPPCGDEDCAALEQLVAVVARHLRRFAAAAPEDAAALRADLQARLLTLLRRHPARPVALFAALALHALDLERLRAEFVLRALFADGEAR